MEGLSIEQEKTGLLLEVRGAILRGMDPLDIGQSVCELIAACAPMRAAWFLWEGAPPAKKDLAAVASGVEVSKPLRLKFERWEGYERLVGRAWSTRAPVLGRPGWESSEPLGSLVVVPLIHGDERLGRLEIFGDPEDLEAWLDILGEVGLDLSLGLARAEAADRYQKTRSEMDAIRRLAGDIISGQPLDNLLEMIVERAVALIGGYGGGMYLCDHKARMARCVVSHGTDRDYRGTELAFGEGAAGVVAESGEPLIITDYAKWDHRSGKLEGDSFSSVLSAPMKWQRQVTGVIHILREKETPPFTPADLELLTLFADQAAVVLENARLLEDVRMRMRQLDQLNALTRAALGAKDLGDLVERVCEHMTALVQAAECRMAFLDSRSQEIIPAGDPSQATAADASRVLSADAISLLMEALSTEAPMVRGGRDSANVLGGTSMVALPLIAGSENLGGLLLAFEGRRMLTQHELALCEQAAGQVALALAKMQALEGERRRSRELEAVREASLSVTSNLELETVFDSILASALKLVAADDAHIFLYEGGKLSFGAAQWAAGVQGEPYREPREDGLTYLVARSGEAMVIPNVNEHPLFTEWKWGGAIVGLPLKIGERVVGVMNVAMLRPHVFDDAELRAMRLLADQAAIMIQNARLFENVVREQRHIQLVYDVAQELVDVLTPDEILERAVTLTVKHLGAHAGEVVLVGPDGRQLIPFASIRKDGITLSELQTRFDLSMGHGLIGWVAENRLPALVKDVREDERWVVIPGVDEEMRSALCAPVISEDRILGVFALFHRQAGAFEEDHQELLASIAHQVSLALANAHRYEALERRLAEMAAVRQVVQVVNRRLEMQPLLEEIVHQVGEVLGYPIVEVYLVEENDLVLRAGHGGPLDLGVRYGMEEGILGRVMRSGEPALVPDASADPDYIPGTPETRTEIVVPMRKGEVVVGVLNVESPNPGDLSEDDLRLLMLLADQISVAIENAALYERLRTHADELEGVVQERTAELAEALVKAQAADRLKTQFVSDVSHELRTPLSNIRLYLDLIRKGREERFESYLQTLDRETNRLSSLIEDLLAISRLDAGTAIPSPVALDINSLARGLVEDRRRLFAGRDLKLRLSLDAKLPTVQADAKMISQVVANLMTNALNYTPAGGRVTISTAPRWDEGGRAWVTLTVEDNGLGIPREEQDRIFDRFYRGEASRSMGTPGTGLGLSICREILERHGGRITLKSQPGKGSQFTMWLPV